MMIQSVQSAISSNIYRAKSPNSFDGALKQALSELSADSAKELKTAQNYKQTENPYKHIGLPDQVYEQLEIAMNAQGYKMGASLDSKAGEVEGIVIALLITRAQLVDQSFASIGNFDPVKPISNADQIDWQQLISEIAIEAKSALQKDKLNEARGWFEESLKSPHHHSYYLSASQQQAWIERELKEFIARTSLLADIASYMEENYAPKS